MYELRGSDAFVDWIVIGAILLGIVSIIQLVRALMTQPSPTMAERHANGLAAAKATSAMLDSSMPMYDPQKPHRDKRRKDEEEIAHSISENVLRKLDPKNTWVQGDREFMGEGYHLTMGIAQIPHALIDLSINLKHPHFSQLRWREGFLNGHKMNRRISSGDTEGVEAATALIVEYLNASPEKRVANCISLKLIEGLAVPPDTLWMHPAEVPGEGSTIVIGKKGEKALLTTTVNFKRGADEHLIWIEGALAGDNPVKKMSRLDREEALLEAIRQMKEYIQSRL